MSDSAEPGNVPLPVSNPSSDSLVSEPSIPEGFASISLDNQVSGDVDGFIDSCKFETLGEPQSLSQPSPAMLTEILCDDSLSAGCSPMEVSDDNMGLNPLPPQPISMIMPEHATTHMDNSHREDDENHYRGFMSILNEDDDNGGGCGDFQRTQQSDSLLRDSPACEEPAESKPTGVGAGLSNLGNTCFINSVLQCFTHTVPLIQGLRFFDHPRACESNNYGFCVLCCLRDHIELALNSSGDVIAPQDFVHNLNYFSSCFQRFQQEDAHEFLQSFLDKLERACLDSSKKKDNFISQHANIVEQVFGGRLISRLRCCNCFSLSDTYEASVGLSLEIEDVDSLQSALESFTRVEKLEDELTCDDCKGKVLKEKQLLLDQAPVVASFHLKRFKNDGISVDKIYKHVEFPLELDLQPYTISGQSNKVGLKYHLYAFVEHVGASLTSGHYFSYVRSSPNTWYQLDDSTVSRVSEAYVLAQDAYILFYAREDMPWFASIFELKKPCPQTNSLNSSPKSVLDAVSNDSTSDQDAENFDGGRPSGPRNVVYEAPTVSSHGGCEGIYVNESKRSVSTPTQTKEDIPTTDDPVPLRSSPENHTNSSRGIGSVATTLNAHPRPLKYSPDRSYRRHQGASYQIPRDHLKVERHQPLKKRLYNKSLEDQSKAIARRYLQKNVPSSRAFLLSAAMRCSPDSSPIKQKKRMQSSPCNKTIPRVPHEEDHKHVTRPLVLR